MIRDFYKTQKHLLRKRTHIVLTNVCNLSCGGCHEFCGQFKKDDLWFIPLDDFENQVNIIKKYEYSKGENIQFPSEESKNISNNMEKYYGKIKNKKIKEMFNYTSVSDARERAKISVFGGEPTTHPKWKELIKIMHKHDDITFKVSTNGRLGHTHGEVDENIIYVVDKKSNQIFTPTLISPSDLMPNKSKKYFWIKAQRDCELWKQCASSIYKNKAYFCEVAAAMDHLFGNGENGWSIEDGKYPFDKTLEEINEQAEKFCHRCAWCIKDEPIIKNYKQPITEPSLISISNMKDLKKPQEKMLNLVQIEIKTKNKKQSHET